MEKTLIHPYVAIRTGVILAADAGDCFLYYLCYQFSISTIEGSFIAEKKGLGLFYDSGRLFSIPFHFWGFESLNYTSVASSMILVTLQPISAFIAKLSSAALSSDMQDFYGLLSIYCLDKISGEEFLLLHIRSLSIQSVQ